MALFVCGSCGFEKETRCKPRKCPSCGASDSFKKKEEKKEETGPKRCCRR